MAVAMGNGAELWREPGLGLDVDDEPDTNTDATALLTARLISASDVARALDAPCSRCRQAEREGKPRRQCRSLGCDRWSTRRARRLLRRSQCRQQPGDPPCPARLGGRCPCQLGMQLWPNGPWRTTLAALRDRLPGVADLVLVGRADDEDA
jgi:hypothetical protein